MHTFRLGVLFSPLYEAHRRSHNDPIDGYPQKNSVENGVNDISAAHVITC